MSKLKSAAAAAFAVVVSKEFRPFEVRLGRAIFVAIVGALGIKFGLS